MAATFECGRVEVAKRHSSTSDELVLETVFTNYIYGETCQTRGKAVETLPAQLCPTLFRSQATTLQEECPKPAVEACGIDTLKLLLTVEHGKVHRFLYNITLTLAAKPVYGNRGVIVAVGKPTGGIGREFQYGRTA